MQPTTVGANRSSLTVPSMPAIAGHCLCGAVTITVAGDHDPRVGACHCRMCQRWSGGLFLCFTADASAVTVSGEVTRYRSSAFAERAFCSRCGSHLWFDDVSEGGETENYELDARPVRRGRQLAASIRNLRGPCNDLGPSRRQPSAHEPGRLRGRESVR